MDKVYCPWCGSEMELEHYGIGEDEYFVYVCQDCAAQSPISYCAESALATALARPLQKPPIDAEPVRHGYWITVIRHEHYPSGIEYEADYCSECSGRGSLEYNFCPNCGAKMDKEEHDG